MGVFSIGKGFAAKAAVLSFLLGVSSVPFGCSKGDNQQAQGTDAAAPAVDPGKEHFEKGVQFTMQGKHEEAIKAYQETIKFNPRSAEAYNNMGFAYMDIGKLNEAIENQKKALEIDPGLANGYYGLAMALEKKGDKKNAIGSWKEFMKLSEPHSKWWLKAQEHLKNLEKSGKK